MVFLMATRQTLTLFNNGITWSLDITKGMVELPGLVVSVLALLTIISLGKIISEERSRLSQLSAANQALVHQIAKRQQVEKKIGILSQVIEQSSESIFITNLEAKIEYVNAAFIRNTGYSSEEVIGRTPRILTSGRTPKKTYRQLLETLSHGESWQGELCNRRKNGDEFIEWALISPLRGIDGKISHYVAIKQDITEKKKAEEKINYLAYYDALTGLPNRNLFLDHLSQSLELAQRSFNLGALILINIDRFKNINDACGHVLGDTLLQSISKQLEELQDENSFLARLGSDEFAILLSDLGTRTIPAINIVNTIADKIKKTHNRFFAIGSQKISISISMGITIYPDKAESDNAELVLRRADTALHRAKANGGNSSAYFESDMSDLVQQRFNIERELQQAIPNGELVLYLQSQLDANGKMVGAEALVRWEHPERGLIPPGAFIPIAEESDLIIKVGNWVLVEALKLMAKADMAGFPFYLSVNVSPRQFRQPNFIALLKDQLALTGADPTHLTLEVTEDLVIENINEIIAKMSEISALGINLSLDDFGTGYSSLAYLKRLPVQELKIDRSFIHDAIHNREDALLVDAILSVAKHLHLKVVAEGVETAEHAAFLNERGNVIHQGYFYDQPKAAEDWFKQSFGTDLV